MHRLSLCKSPSSLPLVIKIDEQQLTVQMLMAIQFTVHYGQRNGEWMNVATDSSITSSTKQPAPGEGVCAEWCCHFECFGLATEQGAPARVMPDWHPLRAEEGVTLLLLTNYTRQPCSYLGDHSLVPNVGQDDARPYTRLSLLSYSCSPLCPPLAGRIDQETQAHKGWMQHPNCIYANTEETQSHHSHSLSALCTRELR